MLLGSLADVSILLGRPPGQTCVYFVHHIHLLRVCFLKKREEELTPSAGTARLRESTLPCRVAQHIGLVRNHKPKEITRSPRESAVVHLALPSKRPALLLSCRPPLGGKCCIQRPEGSQWPVGVKEWETAQPNWEVIRRANGKLARFQGKVSRKRCHRATRTQATAVHCHFGKTTLTTASTLQ